MSFRARRDSYGPPHSAIFTMNDEMKAAEAESIAGVIRSCRDQFANAHLYYSQTELTDAWNDIWGRVQKKLKGPPIFDSAPDVMTGPLRKRPRTQGIPSIILNQPDNNANVEDNTPLVLSAGPITTSPVRLSENGSSPGTSPLSSRSRRRKSEHSRDGLFSRPPANPSGSLNLPAIETTHTENKSMSISSAISTRSPANDECLDYLDVRLYKDKKSDGSLPVKAFVDLGHNAGAPLLSEDIAEQLDCGWSRDTASQAGLEDVELSGAGDSKFKPLGVLRLYADFHTEESRNNTTRSSHPFLSKSLNFWVVDSKFIQGDCVINCKTACREISILYHALGPKVLQILQYFLQWSRQHQIEADTVVAGLIHYAGERTQPGN